MKETATDHMDTAVVVMVMMMIVVVVVVVAAATVAVAVAVAVSGTICGRVYLLYGAIVQFNSISLSSFLILVVTNKISFIYPAVFFSFIVIVKNS